MVKSKTQQIELEYNHLADYAKALSHPARIKILKVLTERNSCICGEIVEALPLSQSTVSQHLKELKRVGLIKGDIEGPRTCYCVNQDGLSQAKSMFSDLFSEICTYC